MILAVPERYIIRRIFAYRTAEGKFAAGIFAHVLFLKMSSGIVIVVSVGAVVNLETDGGFAVIKPRVPISKSVTVRVGLVAAFLVHNSYRVAYAVKVRVAYAYHADNTVSRRIARA